MLPLFIVCVPFILLGQQLSDTQTMRAVMEESIQRQRESVRKQVEAAQAGHPGWFTTRGLTDLDVPSARQTAPLFSAPILCRPLSEDALAPTIQAAASREGQSAELLRAIIRKESAFYPCATSSKGAMGLMQLMPATASSLGVNNPFDAAQNIDGGTKYIRELLARYGGNLKLALAAYNAGPAKVDRFGGVPPIPETRNYVQEILKSIQATAEE